MSLTSAQLAAVKADILASGDLNANPNNADGNFAIAALYNQLASPDYFVWQTSVPVDAIADAIVFANMTPAQAPDGTQAWANRALQCQGKQFNLQNLLLGKSSINAAKANIRAAFQDCLTQLPSKSDGTNQAAGWVQVQLAMSRKATRVEKLLVNAGAGGNGTQATPSTMGYEGAISYTDVEQARNS